MNGTRIDGKNSSVFLQHRSISKEKDQGICKFFLHMPRYVTFWEAYEAMRQRRFDAA